MLLGFAVAVVGTDDALDEVVADDVDVFEVAEADAFYSVEDVEEIARVTGATVGTVRSRIHYGKRALRTVWEGKLL